MSIEIKSRALLAGILCSAATVCLLACTKPMPADLKAAGYEVQIDLPPKTFLQAIPTQFPDRLSFLVDDYKGEHIDRNAYTYTLKDGKLTEYERWPASVLLWPRLYIADGSLAYFGKDKSGTPPDLYVLRNKPKGGDTYKIENPAADLYPSSIWLEPGQCWILKNDHLQAYKYEGSRLVGSGAPIEVKGVFTGVSSGRALKVIVTAKSFQVLSGTNDPGVKLSQVLTKALRGIRKCYRIAHMKSSSWGVPVPGVFTDSFVAYKSRNSVILIDVDGGRFELPEQDYFTVAPDGRSRTARERQVVDQSPEAAAQQERGSAPPEYLTHAVSLIAVDDQTIAIVDATLQRIVLISRAPR